MTVRFDNDESKFIFDNSLILSVDEKPTDPKRFITILNNTDDDDDNNINYEYFDTKLYDIVLMIEKKDKDNIKFSLIDRHYAWNSYEKYLYSWSERTTPPTFAEITVPINDCKQALLDFANLVSKEDE